MQVPFPFPAKVLKNLAFNLNEMWIEIVSHAQGQQFSVSEMFIVVANSLVN